MTPFRHKIDMYRPDEQGGWALRSSSWFGGLGNNEVPVPDKFFYLYNRLHTLRAPAALQGLWAQEATEWGPMTRPSHRSRALEHAANHAFFNYCKCVCGGCFDGSSG